MDRRIVALLVALGIVFASLTAILLLLPSPGPERGELSLEPVMEGLAFPVSLALTEDGRMFYNELQQGRVRIIEDGMLQDEPFLSLDVVRLSETGLLGLALDPDFTSQPFVYLYYTYDSGEGVFNRISRFRGLGNVAGQEEVLLDRIPASSIHNSGRLLFGPDGRLYASVGDARDRELAQDPAFLNGKILRLNPNGSLPEDNPFGNYYAYLMGIRNVFGMDFTPGGLLLFTDNGPRGNDEVNRGLPGLNYGWPLVEGRAQDQRFEDPILVFSSAIAPTGLAVYTGDALGAYYTNTAFFGSWNDGTLYRIVGNVDEDQEGFEAVVELQANGGVLDVLNGPDGVLYISTTTGIFRVVREEPTDEGQSAITYLGSVGLQQPSEQRTAGVSPRIPTEDVNLRHA